MCEKNFLHGKLIASLIKLILSRERTKEEIINNYIFFYFRDNFFY